MPNLVIYQQSYTLILPQPDDTRIEVPLPAVAERDARFLVTWLHGKSQRRYAPIPTIWADSMSTRANRCSRLRLRTLSTS